MKATRKSLVILLSLITAAALLAACAKGGGGDAGKNANAGTPANAAASSANDAAVEAKEGTSEDQQVDLKPYTVKLNFISATQEDEGLVEEAMNKILEPKINAKIDIETWDWAQYFDKYKLGIASGEPADLVFVASWGGFAQDVAKGGFLDLTDLLESHGQDIKKNLNPLFLEGSKLNGKNYAVPTNKELAAARGVVIRKDLIDKYGLDLSGVKTPADLTPILQTLKEKEPDLIPIYMDGGTNIPRHLTQWDDLGSGWQSAIYKNGSDTKVFNSLEDPEFYNLLKLTREWYEKGYINKDAATSKANAGELAKAGKIGMWEESLKPGKDKELEQSLGIKLTQVILQEPTVTTGDTSSGMIAISKNSKDPERAMMVLNLLHSDKELINLLVYGIEGKHYEKVSENVVKPGPDRAKWNVIGNSWMLAGQRLLMLGENEDPDKWEQFEKFDASAKSSPALGFNFDIEPVKNEQTAVDKAGEKYFSLLVTGSIDPDEGLAKMKESLTKAGLGKIIAEKQKQLDAWLADKK